MSFELALDEDEKILSDLLAEDKYCKLVNYDIKFKLFTKRAKRDKDGNIKSPALTKNGISVPAQIKIVSNFNRITDNTDVKIILNEEHWNELTTNEKKGVLENMVNYIEVKEDKDGEPLTISDSCDKVQLKLKHPDFYCEGFLDMMAIYQKDYLPWQDAKAIADNVGKVIQKEEPAAEAEPAEEKKPSRPKKKAEEPAEAPKEEEDLSTDIDDLVNGVI